MSFTCALGNCQGQSIFRSAFSLDPTKKTYNVVLNAYKLLFKSCGYELPKDKKVNYSRSSGMNRGDEFGADSTRNDQMSSHEVKGRQNTCYMRPDPYQMNHVNSGHFWLPDYQPYWNDHTNLVVQKCMISKYSLLISGIWRERRWTVIKQIWLITWWMFLFRMVYTLLCKTVSLLVQESLNFNKNFQELFFALNDHNTDCRN